MAQRDPATAVATLIGPLNRSFVFEGGLAFAPDVKAYGANAGDASEPQLFTINLATGNATTIGIISGGDHDINGLAFRSDGMLVGLDRASNSLLVINPATAASSVLANVPATVGAVGGMTIVDGIAYLNTSGPTATFPGSNSLYSFDLLTGVSTLIGGFSPTVTQGGISGLAATVPEPSTTVLAALGAVGLLIAARRRG